MEILFQINREFDSIERRYNRLIDQKRTFAKRAAARIRYILVEGNIEEDRTKALVRLLNNTSQKDMILDELGQKYAFTNRLQVIKEKSFTRPKDIKKLEFIPQKVVKSSEEIQNVENFVVKPLYTQAQLNAFCKKNEVNGVFRVTQHTVKTMEDLEKLLFVWQAVTEETSDTFEIEIGDDFETTDGMKYSKFSIRRK